MINLSKVLKKTDRPPAAFNFVRLLEDDILGTRKNIFELAKRKFLWSYRSGYKGIQARIEDKVDLSTAIKCAGNPNKPGYEPNVDLISAFFDFDKIRNFSTLNPIGFNPGRFVIGRDLWVPVTPLTVIRENGKFNSIFVCGWKNISVLNLQRRRFIMTIVEDGFLSLTDYRDQPAEFVCLPETEIYESSTGLKVVKRSPIVWNRGDYDLLSKSEVDFQVEKYLAARELAALDIAEWVHMVNATNDDNVVNEDGETSKQTDLFR